jgi:phosphoenolpyruvate---glycerone phosphotransferase subunit DhaM
MSRVGIVLVSHSSTLVAGLAELLGQIGGGGVPLGTAGGGPDGGLGTSGERVEAAISAADGGDGVAIIPDLGSAVLTVRTVLDLHPNDEHILVDAPFVEGAVAAVVTAASGGTLEEVVSAAREARNVGKF